jgi:hypothetical protein
MERRPAARLKKAAQLLALLPLAACRPQAEVLRPGTAFSVRGMSRQPALAWVVPAPEFRACGIVAADLRAAQRSAGWSLPVTVVFVGAHPEWMRGWLGTQRVQATLVPLTEREYAKRFGQGAAPALYLVSNGRVVRSLAIAGATDVLPWLRALAHAGDWRGG